MIKEDGYLAFESNETTETKVGLDPMTRYFRERRGRRGNGREG